jgi:hypothetical protein
MYTNTVEFLGKKGSLTIKSGISNSELLRDPLLGRKLLYNSLGAFSSSLDLQQ